MLNCSSNKTFKYYDNFLDLHEIVNFSDLS